jgi:N-acetylglucosamine transport system substrate-binding protein
MTARAGGNRRRFLQQLGATGVALGPGSALLAACATGGGDDDDNGQEPIQGTDDNPFGMPEDGEVEIWIFDGAG